MTRVIPARSLAAALLIPVLTVLTTSVAHAQVTKPVAFGLGAGLSAATGAFGDFYDTGFNMVGSVLFQQSGSPLGFRVDGMYNAFDANSRELRDVSIVSLSGNAVLSPAAVVGPYLIGGVGVYNATRSFIINTTGKATVGYNLGGGFRFALAGFDAIAEVRWTQVGSTDARFFPATFGVIF